MNATGLDTAEKAVKKRHLSNISMHISSCFDEKGNERSFFCAHKITIHAEYPASVLPEERPFRVFQKDDIGFSAQ